MHPCLGAPHFSFRTFVKECLSYFLHPMITILGPTACGKTSLAVALAAHLDAEIISGDSRQVYRGMDIGTGKDLSEYQCGDRQIPYHLIDIAEPGTKYTVFDFQRDFLHAYREITDRKHEVVFCGGSGLYLESVLRAYRLSPVPANPELRQRLEGKTLKELTELLSTFKQLHNKTDVDSAQRAIRAIEIETFYQEHPLELRPFPDIPSLNVGVEVSREVRRSRITARLQSRLQEGMVDEVKGLLDRGIQPDDLIYYGLEYKYVTLHVVGKISFDEMFHQLEIAIHQFAKRQMTWFRGMERRGVKIHWLDGGLPMEDKIKQVMEWKEQTKK